jgi:hypothetical protein
LAVAVPVEFPLQSTSVLVAVTVNVGAGLMVIAGEE